MSTTAAVEVTATLAAPPATTSRGPAVSSPEMGETFDKVLGEQTAKTLGETSVDRRDATTKSAKRDRAMSASTLNAPMSTPKIASLAAAPVSLGALPTSLGVDLKDANETASTAAPSTDELTGSWRTLVPANEAVSAGPHSPAEREDQSAADTAASDTPSAAVVESELSTTPSPLPEGVAAGAKLEGARSSDGRPPAIPVAGAESAPPADTAPSVAAVTVAPSTLSAASAAFSALRTTLPLVAASSSSRSGAPRSGLNERTTAVASASIARTAMGPSSSTGKTFDGPLIAPPMVTNARATVAAPNASAPSDAELSSLDVSSLATSISQATFGSDGSYTINVAMHPSDLGHVQAVVSLNGVDLHVAISPQTPTGHAALASAVETLKSELSRGGLNVNVSLRDPESRSGPRYPDAQRSVPIGADESIAQSEATPVPESLNASQIHLIL